MAIWTGTHGKDDDKNPFAFQNYYSAANQVAVRAGIAERSSNQRVTTEAVERTSAVREHHRESLPKRSQGKRAIIRQIGERSDLRFADGQRTRMVWNSGECSGECLNHLGRCEEINREWPTYRRRKGKVPIRLTVAHLCHTPKCDEKSHLRAMCEPCHLIYDLRCRQLGLSGEDAVKWAAQKRQR